MGSLIKDFQYALRGLRRTPGFTVVAVLTLALGIGINTSVLTVASSTVLRPLPFADAGRLFVVASTLEDEMSWDDASASILELWDLRERSTLLEDVGVFAFHRSATLTGAGLQAQRLQTTFATSAYFNLLGVDPLLGRTFLPAEDREAGQHAVAILSHHLWRDSFGSDPGVIGSSITLTGRPYTVVGVMPPGFYDMRETERPDIWLPLNMGIHFFRTYMFENRQHREYMGLIKIKPGVMLDQAQAEADGIAQQLKTEFPYEHQGRGLRLVPLYDYFYGEIAKPVETLLAGAGIVLLICCLNIASLLLVRGRARRRDIGVHAALGARRSQILRPMIAESLLLAAIGGGLGILIAALTTDAWSAFGGLGQLPFVDVRLSFEVFGFSVLIALATALLFGLAPALQLSRADVRETLQAASRRIAGQRKKHLPRNFLVTLEVALAVVLLVGAGLMVKSLYQLTRTDLGFATQDLLTFNLELRGARYEEREARAQLLERLLSRLEELPATEAVSLWGPSMIGDAHWNWRVTPTGAPPDDPRHQIMTQRINISPGSFQALGIPLLQGRDFLRNEEPYPAILSERLAETLWPGDTPVGKTFTIGPDPAESPLFTIIGVVADVRNRGRFRPESEVGGDVYTSCLHVTPQDVALLIRARGDRAATVEAVRRVVQEIDPDLPLYDVATMEERLAREEGRSRLTMTLMGIYAFISTFLAAFGIYGVLVYSVQQNRNELAVRSMLGAQPGILRWMVVRQGLLSALLGMLLGLLLAIALTRYVESLLYEVEPLDPVTYAGVCTLLLLVVALGAYLPARRASSVDPMEVLRNE